MMVEHGSPAGVAPAGGGAKKISIPVFGRYYSNSNDVWYTFSTVYGNDSANMNWSNSAFPTNLYRGTPFLAIASNKMKLKKVFITALTIAPNAPIEMSLCVMKGKAEEGTHIFSNVATVALFNFNGDGDSLDVEQAIENDVVIEEGERVAFAIKRISGTDTTDIRSLYLNFIFEEVTE